MTSFLPHWDRPLWLLLLPLLALLSWRIWHRERKAGRWQMLLPPAFHSVLLTGGDRKESRKPWLILALAWLLASLALAGPSWQRVEHPAFKRAQPLVVILDSSSKMLAGDLPPSRLEHAKRKLTDILMTRRDAQTAVVVYAGSAHTLVPLSDDRATTANLLAAVSPDIMPEPGQRADLAVARALELLDHGSLGHGRILLMTSALTEHERDAIRRVLNHRSNQLSILGFGTVQGAPIAQPDGGFLRDSQGAILLPRLDTQSLESFAGTIDGDFTTASLDDTDIQSLGLDTALLDAQSNNDVQQPVRWQDQGHWLLIPILLLAAMAGRRGWLLVLPLMLSFPSSGMAFEWRDLWLQPDQQGQRLMSAAQPGEAATRFTDLRWQGVALYESGDYDGAIERFAQGQTAADRYNLGNALARSNKLQAAIDAYEQALQIDPALQAAETNKALVQSLIDERQADQSRGNDETPSSSEESAGPSSTPSAPGEDALRRDEPAPSDQPRNEIPSQTGPNESQTPDVHAPSQGAATSSAERHMAEERRQSLEQWLRQIPDNPSELLRRKFWYEQQQRQETPE